jgi:L-lactate dehydrogenase complex protein LldF
MSKRYKKFISDAEAKSFDAKHRKTLSFNINRYDQAVTRGLGNYADLELARTRGAWIKRHTLNNWADYLVQFEKNALDNGAEVLWALDKDEAMQHVKQVLVEEKAKLIVKGKSMITEELHFNETVEEWGYEAVETDLGEFIVQVAGEKPYHILTPAMHKSKEDVAALFHEKFNTDEDSTPEELTGFVRDVLRKKFVQANVGITGANFLVADSGSVCLTENEGNILLSASMPETHIVLAGIEKLIPSLDHLNTMWPLLAHKGTGQKVTAYNSVFSGPAKSDEGVGPKRMVIILLDNGRTNIYESDEQKEALACIRCGACLNACPVYRLVGGYTYDTTYTGPIGSIISPFMNGFEADKHLSHACSLCEKCGEVCPVKIPLPKLLLSNRRDGVEKGYVETGEKIAMSGLKMVLNDRKKMDMLNGSLKNMGGKIFGAPLWGPRREMPDFAQQSFSRQWKKKNGNKFNL